MFPIPRGDSQMKVYEGGLAKEMVRVGYGFRII